MKVRTEARRDLILATATQVFMELGFEGTSMAEITKRVGGAKATLYGYFPSKEVLFLAVVQAEARRHLEGATADIASRRSASVRDDLLRFGTAYVTFTCSDVAISAVRMVLSQSARSEIGTLFFEQGPGEGLRMMAAALQAAMDRGQLRAADPVAAAHHLEGLLTSETRGRLFQQNPEPVRPAAARKIAERAVDTFLNGYAA